ncbi:MAG: AAA family ATPase [Gammaproteobacteria bacterium]|jgi:class 3 adenylate cyclase/tetratricopeptide (TPR) repeat protein|nr:AAA family ATPase [Gammaproteobacteria bacterium]
MSEQVSKWLDGLGLGQYKASFFEHKVGMQILTEINDADLREMGVAALGHRKTLLKAIDLLRQSGANATNSPVTPGESTQTSDEDITAWSRTPGERKPVTMLFADIVDSTALTEALDAEEAHELLYHATERMCQAVESNQGTVCRIMGDGMMAMFGAPLASERHALEACKAALDMQAAIARYTKKLEQNDAVRIQIRVGLHSGEVVVLDVGDDPNKPEYDASGPTLAVAARLEQAAPAGGILITRNTRTLAAQWIETVAYGEVNAKGLSRPVPVFVLKKIRSRGEPADIAASRPIVGRRSELVQFRGLLQVCSESGHGQSLLIRGEPGIGKTRLVEELVDIARHSGYLPYLALVLDFGTGKGQAAIPSLVRDFLGIAPGSGKSKRERALDDAQSDGITDSEQRVFLNDLLDLRQPLELRTLYDAMEARTRIEGKHRVVGDIVRKLAARTPILLVIEGLHWADAETLDYLTYLATTVTESPVLLLLTTRLEDDPVDYAWRARAGEHPTVTWDLGPLRLEESRQLATRFIGEQDDFVHQCIARAEGNPLFLEQLLLVAERGSIDSVPDSIKSIVLARIDQLDSADKLALRAASVLGQRFELEGLQNLLDNSAYQPGILFLHHLVRPDGAHYMFTHALIQAGIYASLLKNQRAELHRHAAAWYSERDNILHAEHLDRAGDGAAVAAYLQAARHESALYRPERALQLVRRGLEIAPEAESFALKCLEGELLRIVGDIRQSIEAYRCAARVAGGEIGRCNALIGVAQGLAATGEHSEALEILQDATDIASEHSLALEDARIFRGMGNVYFYRGDIEACLAANKRSLDFARAAASVEVEVHALSGLANAEYNRGRFISAQRYFDQCLELAQEHGFGRAIAANLSMRSYVSCWQNDIESAIAGYREAAQLAVQINDPRAQMMALMIGGSFWSLVGDVDEGEKWLTSSMKIIRRIDARLFEGVCVYLLGRFALLRGDRHEARSLTQRGISILQESESGMTFGGPIALGILALAAEDEQQCHTTLAQAEAILEGGSVGHNYLNFYEDAMEACLQFGAWDEVDRYARALVDYTSPEPLPRSNYFIARGRALADFGRGKRDVPTLQRLHTEVDKNGFRLSRRAIDAALEAI